MKPSISAWPTIGPPTPTFPSPPTCIGNVVGTDRQSWHAKIEVSLLCKHCYPDKFSYQRKIFTGWVPTLKTIRFMCSDCENLVWSCEIDRKHFKMKFKAVFVDGR